MPITPSAKKRMRQDEKRRMRNLSFKSKLRTHHRKLSRAISDQRKEDSQNLLRTVASLYDKGVKKGIYRAQTAARQKSRLAQKVNALAAGAPPAQPPSLPSGEQAV
ncbi:MAG: 30S ribosomal protein S20 [bacterium]|nr:30S ribosomal protein S20 [bacterium]